MQRAHKCPRCGCITRSDHCSCGSPTKLIRDIHLGKRLSVDVSLTLRFDGGILRPFILIQKPSGQERITLQARDLIHV